MNTNLAYQTYKPRTEWRPNEGRQTMALQYRVFEELYGGARGGGKTEAGIVWLLTDNYHLHPKFKALVVRKNIVDIDDWVGRAKEIYTGHGAIYLSSKKKFIFPSGAVVSLGHLQDKEAYTKYQGHEYQRMLIEELTQIPNEEDYIKLISACRSTVDGLHPGIFATTNPTGKGHAWVKKRFISNKEEGAVQPAKPFQVWFPPDTGRSRVYVPSTVFDNPILVTKDPGYLKFLQNLPMALRNAWLHGSWEFGAGQFFDTWHESVHVIPPFEIPTHWRRYISIDYGFSKPSAIYWHAIDPSTQKVYTYREVYVTNHTYSQLAYQIAKKTGQTEVIQYIIADSAMRAKGNESGKSGFTIMQEYFENIKWHVPIYGSKKFAGSRVVGWNIMREYLKPIMSANSILGAKWQVFSTCKNLIRVMPEQFYDERNPEDLDTDAEDHAPDSVRYFLERLELDVLTPEKDPVVKQPKKAPQTAQELWDRYHKIK